MVKLLPAMSFSWNVYLLVLVILNYLQHKCVPSLSFTSYAHRISMARGILKGLSSNLYLVTEGQEDPSTSPFSFYNDCSTSLKALAGTSQFLSTSQSGNIPERKGRMSLVIAISLGSGETIFNVFLCWFLSCFFSHCCL